MTGPMGATGLDASGVGAVAGPMGAARPGGGFFNRGGLLQMGFGAGDLLTGSDFALRRESRGGILSFWSRGARSHFAGREGTLGLGGDVRTTMFGADYASGPMVAGLSLSHSRGLGEYAGAASGQVPSSVTGLYPWLGYRATGRDRLESAPAPGPWAQKSRRNLPRSESSPRRRQTGQHDTSAAAPFAFGLTNVRKLQDGFDSEGGGSTSSITGVVRRAKSRCRVGAPRVAACIRTHPGSPPLPQRAWGHAVVERIRKRMQRRTRTQR